MNETQRPLLSVIIPHLNQEESLERCLESLSSQDFELNRVEIIVVDNGSKQLPTIVCSSFANIRLEQEDMPGPGPARNRGIALSHAPVVACVDADCIARSDWLKTIANVFEADSGLQIIGGDVRIALQNPNNMTMLEAYESIFAYRQKEYIEQRRFSGTGNLAMRRDVFYTVGPFAGIRLAEDRDWGRRATGLGFTIRYIPNMVVLHPARTSFSELFDKWDRHIAHDYAEQAIGVIGKFRWIAKAVALLLSPAGELVRIVRSDRVECLSARWLAFIGLARIRLYRSKRMLSAMSPNKKPTRNEAWNRS